MIPTKTAVETLLRAAGAAAARLRTMPTGVKDRGLLAVAEAVDQRADDILAANAQDVDAARSVLAPALVDRLRLDPERVAGLSRAVRATSALEDPVGQVVRGHRMPNGVGLTEVRVPFGVVAAIYEARPNVTVEIAALAIKSGNAAALRGGSAAARTNACLVEIMRTALAAAGVPSDAVVSVDRYGRDGAAVLMRARGLVDLLIPRGGAGLIRRVVDEATVPVIETGAGNVHVYVDASADAAMAARIIVNAKAQRPSVCNAAETLLVHATAAPRVLPVIARDLHAAGVTLHADSVASEFVGDCIPATDDDWGREYLSLDLAVRVVADIDEAMAHIARFSTHHTETIVTEDRRSAERFLTEVDSAVVMVNASTRFTDGGQFGFGAEVGISTQKLHARGPMGLRELTSTKWLVRGDGQIRE